MRVIESAYLASAARIRLAHLPTALEAMPRLSERSPDVRLFIKRDDCTGLGLGGNKTRKLEFVVGHAQAKGATCLVTCGGWQSNHVRQTAAAAARLGLECHAILWDVTGRRTKSYSSSGNLLLDKLFGATLHFVADEKEAAIQTEQLSAKITWEGGVPYVIPLGASDPIGALGYAECARELILQFEMQNIQPSAIIVATGSAGTQAGLLAGLRAFGSTIAVVGVAVSETTPVKEAKVRELTEATLRLMGKPDTQVESSDVVVLDAYVGEGYATPTKASNEAISVLAEAEGILLDPVYTAKAMAGLLDLMDRSEIKGDVVFLHTGGAPALFAYVEEFGPPLAVTGAD
jgi:D-cysteine desulfhydrase family pyridoxal phosphate-dependent enzyme